MALHPAAAATLSRWHAMVAARDFSSLAELMDPAACFRSPMKYQAYEGADWVVRILQAAMRTFEDFRYEREFESGNADVGLEFAARVGDKQLKGIDLIQFGPDGRIVAFEVMIRPASGLLALGEAMGRALGLPGR
ncbi:nuclear transport factor 2 family protein [Massilia sp. TS11]|uniref:nuclear transport factor 2 family protein n=1 Tax=Massilia sp. TS11 TaxID=2908003 RepID=UPI001EDA67D8|nr:nuclear transport factor 2 family protein [Massilia sp. TS11]MCG2583490.1 nuclear transport factor 2 family protein [Massilia sp. TS11]